ncbi:hypothetical protein [Pelagicoccus sp. SDUM812005]|uniref:hypothetical protein n=1 Tax=Pelagicoccus sp. SDUM812005 TaxID=3041257 RepID=UPI00280E25FA|nr:hypothetical protein [Pelagicoccus sp. SDUM812005]MDQ8182474.1 hypothetical protein [Pelagicoccus sp. SDUM812005]
MNSKLTLPRLSVLARLCVGAVFMVSLLAGSAALEAKPKKKWKSDYTSKFGVMSPGPGGKFRVYAETTYIYRNVDQEYVHGFEVARKDQQRFMGYFEIRFPEPITVTPELEKAYTVMEGGKFIRSTADIHWEVYSSPFWFSEDDPLGTYELTIYIDGEHYRTIKYEVVPFESGLTF